MKAPKNRLGKEAQVFFSTGSGSSSRFRPVWRSIWSSGTYMRQSRVPTFQPTYKTRVTGAAR